MVEGTNGTRVKLWSAKRKTEVVLRLLRGEELEAVSREIQVPAHEIEDWRRVFLEHGTRGLKRASRHPTERCSGTSYSARLETPSFTHRD